MATKEVLCWVWGLPFVYLIPTVDDDNEQKRHEVEKEE